MSQVPSAERSPLVRRPAFWLLVVAAALLVVIAVVLGIALGAPRGVDAATTPGPTSTPPATTDAATAPVTENGAPPAQTGVVIPASCDGIYTHDLTPEFGGLVLNPEWTTVPESGVHYGSRDEAAVELLETTTVVTCKWGHPNGGSDRGLTTNVARIDSQQAADMRDHFEAVGHRCYEELEGVRCVTETPPSTDGQAGESHFFRDDVWVATRWVNAGPDGYTHDIVAAIFG